MNEKEWTEFLDAPDEDARRMAARLPDAEAALAERGAWRALRPLLAESLAAPRLPHPDFLTFRVMESIARENPAPRPAPPVRWLLWPGLASLAAAAGLTFAFLPDAMGPRGDVAFDSQVVSAHAGSPELSVSSFAVPGTRGVVIWIEGTGDIPAQECVR